MAALVWTPSTVVVALIIAALAALAVHRIATRGLCDCHDHCGGGASGSGSGGCAGCAGCKAASRMMADIDCALGEK